MNNTKYWIWLSLALGVASSAPHRLLEAFNGDIGRLYSADENDLKSIRLTDRQYNALLNKSTDEAQRIIDWCSDNNVKILCYDDPVYPKRLAQIPDAPVVLYYIGELYHFDEMLCLAGVGTREMTRYGHDTAYTFCHDLARGGALIVSGLASGIDSVCHRAVLDAGGKTVAVLGVRINKVYPKSNRDLMVEIARKGLLITEFHPFYKTSPANFPKRNRIISGLCQGTIVFEADEGSGSLITARNALKQGRKVYALPGNIGNSGSAGTNALIADGAKIVMRSSDVIKEYMGIYPKLKNVDSFFDYTPKSRRTDSFVSKPRSVRKANEEASVLSEPAKGSVQEPKGSVTDDFVPMVVLEKVEKEIYKRLSESEPASYDSLSIGYSDAEVLSALTMLELKSLITVLPGNRFLKKRVAPAGDDRS